MSEEGMRDSIFDAVFRTYCSRPWEPVSQDSLALSLLLGGGRHHFSSAQSYPWELWTKATTKTQLELGGSQKARPGSELGRRLPEPNKADTHPCWKKKRGAGGVRNRPDKKI